MAISFNNLRNINDTNLIPSCYRVTSGGTVFTSLGFSSVDLWPDTGMAVGDYIIWRITHQVNKPRGMRFHVSTAIAAVGLTGVWEYRKADGTWAAFSGLSDATNNFTTAGTNVDVTWTVPTDWGTNGTAINSITGSLWWRFRITGLTSYTEGGRLGNTTPSVTQIYDNAVRIDTNHEYDSGTATSGGSNTITNSGKAYTVNVLMNRIIYIHTGTGSGQAKVIRSNTATVITVHSAWDTTPDSTSQYRICANFEDVYQADVTGGWGVVTKTGSHMYSFNCYLAVQAGAFGDVNTLIEFTSDYYWYTQSAHTNDYQMHLGWRLPIIYGLDKGIWGNTIISNRTTPLDSRSFGFSLATEYAYSAGNRYILRHDYPLGSDTYLRSWFVNYQKYSINDYFEGWRSVTFPKTSPRTEARNVIVAYGYSGIELPSASFDGVKSYYNSSLALYVTQSTSFTFKNFDLGLNNYENTANIFSSIIQFYAYTAINTKYIGFKRIRPLNDSFSATSNGISYPQAELRCLITDEPGNPLPNARIVGKNVDGTILFDVLSGTEKEFLSDQTISSGGSYSLTSQPSAGTRLRLNITNFSDNSSSSSNNARIVLSGTDNDGNAIKELVLLETYGNGTYLTDREFKTINASGVVTVGWTGTLSIDRAGLIYPQAFDFEKWQSNDDITLTVTSYNPITFTISRPGYEPVTIKKNIYESQNWHMALKRSVIKIE